MNWRKQRIMTLEERLCYVKENVRILEENGNRRFSCLVQKQHLEALEKELQTLYLEEAIYD